MKTKRIVLIVITLLILSAISCAIVFSVGSPTTKESVLGSWWWNKNLSAEEYLSFAKDNNVTEIYYCDYSLDENVANFVEKASAKKIKVYCLAGEKEWLNDRTGLDNLIAKYNNFQKTYKHKLAGIHLDIEPHQFSDFSQNRTSYLLKLLSLMHENKTRYKDINFDYDIPFWLDDEIEYNGQIKETYKHILDVADRTFIMSYRDSAIKMKEVSIDEINYATENKKTLFLCAETYSEEGDSVSYYEEGKQYLLKEIEELRKEIPSSFGIAIHNIQTWKNLKD